MGGMHHLMQTLSILKRTIDLKFSYTEKWQDRNIALVSRPQRQDLNQR